MYVWDPHLIPSTRKPFIFIYLFGIVYCKQVSQKCIIFRHNRFFFFCSVQLFQHLTGDRNPEIEDWTYEFHLTYTLLTFSTLVYETKVYHAKVLEWIKVLQDCRTLFILKIFYNIVPISGWILIMYCKLRNVPSFVQPMLHTKRPLIT